jgi:3-hydroxymyristoyl/3-hydroxydecanoyl-(acyl carrier protein) dehydratase
MLPHQYPFRFVEDRASAEGVWVLLGAGSPWMRSSPALGLSLAIEILAQGAHVLLDGGDAVYLAGVEAAELRAPLDAGDRLRVEARRAGSFGSMTRVEAELRREETAVAKATLILVRGVEAGGGS